MCPTGDKSKYMYKLGTAYERSEQGVTRISMYVNLLYEFIKILISVTVICFMIQYKCMCTSIRYKICFPVSVKLSTSF